MRELVNLTLANKGRTCYLCQLDGESDPADSADHDPPRSVLVGAGVPDPDSVAYLYPSHKLCNLWRGVRDVTPELRAEIRARRLDYLGQAEPVVEPSPRFSRRPTPAEAPAPSIYLSEAPEKTGERQ